MFVFSHQRQQHWNIPYFQQPFKKRQYCADILKAETEKGFANMALKMTKFTVDLDHKHLFLSSSKLIILCTTQKISLEVIFKGKLCTFSTFFCYVIIVSKYFLQFIDLWPGGSHPWRSHSAPGWRFGRLPGTLLSEHGSLVPLPLVFLTSPLWRLRHSPCCKSVKIKITTSCSI